MSKRLYVGNLPYDLCNEEAIRDLFETRKISSVKVINDRETGRPRGFCFVELENDESAIDAIEQLNGSTIGGRTIVVNEARERPPVRNNNNNNNNNNNDRRDNGRPHRDANGRRGNKHHDFD